MLVEKYHSPNPNRPAQHEVDCFQAFDIWKYFFKLKFSFSNLNEKSLLRVIFFEKICYYSPMGISILSRMAVISTL